MNVLTFGRSSTSSDVASEETKGTYKPRQTKHIELDSIIPPVVQQAAGQENQAYTSDEEDREDEAGGDNVKEEETSMVDIVATKDDDDATQVKLRVKTEPKPSNHPPSKLLNGPTQKPSVQFQTMPEVRTISDTESSRGSIDTSVLDNEQNFVEFQITNEKDSLFNLEKCFESAKVVVKIFFQLLMFCLILGCMVVSKGCVLFIASQLNPFVSFKRTGLLNETYYEKDFVMTTEAWYTTTEDFTNISMGTTEPFTGTAEPHMCENEEDCQQCGVPVCIEERDPACSQKESVRWVWCMFLCQCVPYFIMFLRCLWKMCFRRKKGFSLLPFLTVLVVESLYTLGMFLLLYVQLPKLDVQRGLFLFSSVAFIPVFLKLFTPSPYEMKPLGKRFCWLLVDLIALLMQASPIILWMAYIGNNPIEFGSTNSTEEMKDICPHVYIPPPTQPTTQMPTTEFDQNITATSNINIGNIRRLDDEASTEEPTTTEPPLEEITYVFRQLGILPENVNDLIFIPLIMLLVSLGFWENFIDENSAFCCKPLNSLRRGIHKAKTKIYFLVSIWKIVLTFILIVVYYSGIQPLNVDDIKVSVFNSSLFYDNMCEVRDLPSDDADYSGHFHSDWLYVALIQNSVGILCFYFVDLVIKGQMEIMSFTLPLTLVTPVCFVLSWWACTGCYQAWDFGTPYYWNCFSGHESYSEYMNNRYTYVGFLLWVSLLLITRYLWRPIDVRMIKLDRVFSYIVPEGTMLDQALMLTRRRYDEELHSKPQKGKKDESPIKYPNTKIGEAQKEVTVPTLVNNTPQIPFIYMCATMWHENDREMLQMLKSIFRVNKDQASREQYKTMFNDTDNDYYQFEAHIFFDDAFEYHDPKVETGFNTNDFVKKFIKTLNVSASEIMGQCYKMDPPIIYKTPYGGRLEWILPVAENKLIMHLKDKQLIRHRKRWSQIMYLYRILSLGLASQPGNEKVTKAVAKNSFILALDGDIDFKPEAVLLLVDLMKRNHKVAAACGRIHPIGAGPMVWYQKFEYSISHWLQKATEHVLGCVLCSPGCFSLFRCSALMDDNVTQMYSTRPTKPIHHVQYDQGEDRWLCTLLLQQGYRVEYAAAADAYTYAPEEFKEFYNQRRRWITSTFANLLDLLKSGRHTASKNENISLLYMAYQALLFTASILGPATIFMLIVGAFNTAFGIDPLISFFLGLVPMVLFMILCFKTKTDIQIKFAALLSVIFAILQMLVIVGISQQMVEDGVCAPSSIFFLFVVGSFVLGAILHPYEFFNLFHGFLYYLFIPSMYLILIIYSLCNLHVIAWGTRETKQPANQQQVQQEIAKEAKKKDEGSMWEKLLRMNNIGKSSGGGKGGWSINCLPCCLLRCCSQDDGENSLENTLQIAKTIEEAKNGDAKNRPNSLNMDGVVQDSTDEPDSGSATSSSNRARDAKEANDYAPYSSLLHEPVHVPQTWHRDLIKLIHDESLFTVKHIENNLQAKDLSDYEAGFWTWLIEKYLYPLELSEKEKSDQAEGLVGLRDKAVFSFFLIDMLLMVLVLGFTKSGLAIKWTCTAGSKTFESELDPIGFAFVFIFGSVLAIQVVGMLIHRMFTFIQIMSTTVICKTNQLDEDKPTEEQSPNEIDKSQYSKQQVINLIKEMQRFDYDDNFRQDENSFDHTDNGNDIDDEGDNAFTRLLVTDEDDMVEKRKVSNVVLDRRSSQAIIAARFKKLTDEIMGKEQQDSQHHPTSQSSHNRPSFFNHTKLSMAEELQKIVPDIKTIVETNRENIEQYIVENEDDDMDEEEEERHYKMWQRGRHSRPSLYNSTAVDSRNSDFRRSTVNPSYV